MTDETGYGVLTDAQWADLAPLIESCCPPHRTEHKNLRRTIEAIIWRHENGAKWRSIPLHLGPWWMAAQTFGAAMAYGNTCLSWRNSAKGSSWGWRSSTAARSGPRLSLPPGSAWRNLWPVSPTKTPLVRQKRGTSSAQRDKREALGCSRGGLSTEASVIVDGSGRAIGFALAQGQANELPMAPVLLRFLTALALWITADCGYSSHADLEPRLAPGHPDQAE